jgi:hypothetical protein
MEEYDKKLYKHLISTDYLDEDYNKLHTSYLRNKDSSKTRSTNYIWMMIYLLIIIVLLLLAFITK